MLEKAHRGNTGGTINTVMKIVRRWLFFLGGRVEERTARDHADV